MTRSVDVLIALWSVLYAPLCQAASKFDGLWRGTYNSHPVETMPDGSYPEKVNEFELSLHESKGIVTGVFTSGTLDSGRSRSIMNGKIFGDRACFDVFSEFEDMRWCVNVSGGQLYGTWSRGPEGGPILGGAGAGIRIYQIRGGRVTRNRGPGQSSHLPK